MTHFKNSNGRCYSVAEFFCGCGGLSHGFWRTGRFSVLLGNDLKKPALNTFKFNHREGDREPAVFCEDIRKISVNAVVRELRLRGVLEGELDCLIGGPPCQGFSQMRRSEERKGNAIVRFKGYDQLSHDPRNDLVLRFLEIADELKPKFILIENVPQMLRHGHNGVPGGLAKDVQDLLADMGYSTVVRVLNAADYGVPQMRERAFFLASRIGKPQFPAITHVDPDAPELVTASLPPWRTVADAINDLPFDPPLKDDLGGAPLSAYPDVPLSEYASFMRSKRSFPFNHITRLYSERVISIISEMRAGETWDTESARMQKKYSGIVRKHRQRGEDETATLKRLQKAGVVNPAFFNRYYWSAYTRLRWNRPALTITANANFLGSGRFTHPQRQRGITMREAARLQSFDDDFRFITAEDGQDTMRAGIGMDMIGEAVPPLLGQAFAAEICCKLDAHPESPSLMGHEPERRTALAHPRH